MKKNEVKKLRLSRETLQALTSSDMQTVVGGSKFSCLSGKCVPPLGGDGGGGLCD
jgi:hypothetical protein